MTWGRGYISKKEIGMHRIWGRKNTHIKGLFATVKKLLDFLDDGVIIADENRTVIILNSAAEELTGWDKKDALGKRIEDVICFYNGDHGDYDFQYKFSNYNILRKKDGSEIPIFYKEVDLDFEDTDKKYVGVVLKGLSSYIKRHNKMLRLERLEPLCLISRGIAHDLNNLLGAIMMNLDMLRLLEDKDKEKLKEILDRIDKSILKSRQLINRLSNIYKREYEEKQLFSIEEALKDTVKFMLTGSKIKYRFEIGDDLCRVFGDRLQIEQVIQNIVLNAREAMKEEGLLVVRVENFECDKEEPRLKPGRYIKIDIQDYGCGISSDNMPKIFDPYFTTKENGSGLGLAVSYQIVKEHNGHIEVQSIQGEGTIFTIYLPCP